MNTLTIELTPLERQRVDFAEANGVDVRALMREILSTLPPPSVSLSPTERAQAFLEWAESHRNRVFPSLSDADISRESIYGERG